ncbi:helix-turn-helix transcriptional regulator [Clostridium uliginosum]|uniref:LuxR family transcriptional regulator, maltose regulon positive regulatory protein n=1 Tax=Clostridium uliginosum TaxID=119641 RepID=A0A1I1RYB2_9CLOT|nr:LuxR C-terminal-related transcriptional regulator [Clostridium uliginosum]SFD35630.1 LuxR family transcriptional regulator, maltose regulon positive regulatory protein [Clostridium uliginosum]
MINKIFRPKIMHRRRIDKILSQIFEVPIFFISASMGYGKTTSVKNFIEKKKKIQTIWLDISNEENDGVLIWNKFCNSIKSTNFNLSKRLITYGFPRNNMEAHEIIDIIRDEIKQKTVIVIDDWYDKRTIYISYLIKAIVLEEIPNLHIVIISRNRPTDEYIELELKQKCRVMWQDDIAFTFNETVEFFEINKIILTEKEKKEVYEYTGGWTSATYLALLQYYNKNTFDNIPKATELIKTAVYDKFDEKTKQILLKLAPVEKFTLEQAVYITGNKKSNYVIKNLQSNNCFIKYDSKLKTYTLHSILRSALEEELLSSDVDLNKINNACGEWYYKNLKDIDAIEYYYKAKNFKRILDLMERNDTIDLTNLYKRIINSVFDELSMEEKISRPIAYLTYLFFYVLYGNPIVGEKLLCEAKTIYEVDENLKDKNQLLGEIIFLQSLLIMDDVKKMIEYHKKAYEFFGRGTSKIANDKMPITFGSPHFLCLYHTQKGNFKEMSEYFEQGIHYFIHISNGGGTGANYLMRAEYFFETGDLYNGELFAYKALYKAKSKNQTSIIICSIFLLLRICVNKNDRCEVRNKFNTLIKEYENLNIPRFLNGAKLALGYIDGITGNLQDMHNWNKDVEKSNSQMKSPVANMSYIILGLAMILKGNYIELEVQVETMLECYGKKNNIFGILYAYIFDSVAKYKLYDIQQAKNSLLKAIDLAKEDNIVMCFVELAPHILPILKDLEKENEYVKMLLPKCIKFNEIYEKNYCYVEKVELTPRELEVMQLVDEGYKQSEISEKLNIALITVKKHIASVYSKLNVKNKTIAIKILKEKGII